MRNKRTAKFLKQKSYMIAAVIMLAAAFGMTGVYFSQQSNEEKEQQQELAAKEELKLQEEAAEKERKGIEEAKRASNDMLSENDDFMDSPEMINKTEIADSDEDDRKVAAGENTTDQVDILKENEAEAVTEEVEEVSSEPVPVLSFSAEADLNWPLQGNVILDYNMDQTVYFATLDQYKYNPAIVIQAAVNDKVTSVAQGKVQSIVTDEVTGHTVTVELGNGYSAVYGQLKEIPFVEGDYVDAGEIIGYVSEPTKYYSVEGANVYFQLLKDNTPVNPMEFLN